MDKITINMATIPQRLYALQEVLPGLLPQCDYFNLYMNGWKEIPDFVKHPKITIYRSEEEVGDIGDVGKFYDAENFNGYIFTCDDKIIYPPDYVTTMLKTIEQYKRKAVVSCHGRIFNPGKINSYYWHAEEFLGCLMNISSDKFVHEIGTGVMAFHTDTYKPSLKIFKHKNMTDIYVSIDLLKKKIPRLIRAHKEGWIRTSRKFDSSYSISQTLNKRDHLQTEVINNYKWQIHTI